MENFTLQPNESVLYKGQVSFIKKNENYLESLSKNETTELVLTNLNLVFINKTKKLFAKEQVDVETYSIEEIKIYNGEPQIKQKDTNIEIFLTNGEKTLSFSSKSEVRKFIDKSYTLLTGKSLSVRVSDKVKGTINLVDNTVGINTVGTIKTVVENGVVGTILGGFGKNTKVQSRGGTPLMEVIGVAKDLLPNKTKVQETQQTYIEPSKSIDNQIETLKKLKDLLDSGIITQDEFDTKKKQILNME